MLVVDHQRGIARRMTSQYDARIWIRVSLDWKEMALALALALVEALEGEVASGIICLLALASWRVPLFLILLF